MPPTLPEFCLFFLQLSYVGFVLSIFWSFHNYPLLSLIVHEGTACSEVFWCQREGLKQFLCYIQNKWTYRLIELTSIFVRYLSREDACLCFTPNFNIIVLGQVFFDNDYLTDIPLTLPQTVILPWLRLLYFSTWLF